MIKRRDPSPIYYDVPCSMVAVGTATGSFPPAPVDLASDGYLSLAGMNKYCRSMLPVTKAVAYRRGERPSLKEFLEGNTKRAVICVLGHFIYAAGNTYWSFLRNAKDPVVKVWYLKEVG